MCCRNPSLSNPCLPKNYQFLSCELDLSGFLPFRLIDDKITDKPNDFRYGSFSFNAYGLLHKLCDGTLHELLNARHSVCTPKVRRR